MVAAGLGLVVMGTAMPATPVSAGDLGFADLEVFRPDGDTYAYGDPVVFSGIVSDASTSCSSVRDCDTPVGNVVIEMPPGSGTGFNLPVSPSEIEPTAQFSHVVPGPTTDPPTSGFIIPGSYGFDASFSGNFTTSGLPEFGSFTITARPCGMTVAQSVQQSAPSSTITVTADVSTSSAHASGRVRFFQGPVANDVLLGTVDPVPLDNVASIDVDTDLLAVGANTINVVYQPDNDNHLGCTVAVTHTVVNGDVPPTANPDNVSVTANVPSGTNSVTFNPLANDSDPDGTPITDFEFVAVDPGDPLGPQRGELVDAAGPPGTVTYTPDAGEVGEDTFDYFVTTNGVQSAPATININIECTPEAADDAYEVAQGGELVVDDDADDVFSNDPIRCEESAAVEDEPEHGSVDFDGFNGEFTYTPEPGFAGVDAFTYVYSSGQVVDSRGTVFVEVVAPAQATTTSLATTSTTIGGGSTSTTGVGGTATTARVGGTGSNQGGALARTGDGPSGALVVAGALLVVGGLCYGAPVTTGRRRRSA